MLRIAVYKSGEIKVNAREGRGAYICKDEKCLNAAIKKGSIARGLKCQIDSEVYAELGALLKE